MINNDFTIEDMRAAFEAGRESKFTCTESFAGIEYPSHGYDFDFEEWSRKYFGVEEIKNEDEACEHCGNSDATYCINPYDEDIRGEENWQWICDDCYSNMMGDI